MPLLSANGPPNVGVRSDFMGLAVVNKLSPTRALIIAKEGNRDDTWVLVTPEYTYKDATVDLMEKLKIGMNVAYKAVRTWSKTYKGTAIYIRPVDECHVGEAKLVVVRPTMCYASSSKIGSIFFPGSAIKESVVIDPLLRRGLDKGLRVGDPISFVAIKDYSTQNRSAYAVEVNLTFNQDTAKPMVGIITETRHSSCTVWAKNFPPLYFDDVHFGLDSSADLREIFSEGDRVSFRATKIGCDYDGISQIEALNCKPIAKLQDARAAVGAGSRRSMLEPKIEKPRTDNHVPVPSSESLAGSFGGPDNQENAIKGATAMIKESPTEKEMFSSGEYDNDADSQKSVDRTNSAVVKVDAEVQVRNTFEEEAVRQLLQDEEIFKLALQRFPTIVRDWCMRRMI